MQIPHSAQVAAAALVYIGAVYCVTRGSAYLMNSFKTPKLPEEVHLFAERLLRHDCEDDDKPALEPVYPLCTPECPDPTPDHFIVRKKCRLRFIRQLRLVAHEEFGLMRRTEANRLVVQRYLRDYMRSKSVRTKDIALILPLAVEMAFTATEGTLAGREIRETFGVRENANMMDGPLDGRTSTEMFWSWFGVKPAPKVHFEK